MTRIVQCKQQYKTIYSVADNNAEHSVLLSSDRRAQIEQDSR